MEAREEEEWMRQQKAAADDSRKPNVYTKVKFTKETPYAESFEAPEYVVTNERQEPWRPPLYRPAQRRREEPKRERKLVTVEDWPIRRPWLEKGQAFNGSGIPRLNLLQLTRPELEAFVTEELKDNVRWAGHIYTCIYKYGITNFTRMRRLPYSLKKKLMQEAVIGAEDWSVLATRISTDGTEKRAYGIPGGHAIESVLMPYEDGRQTACISSQAGCAMGCVFCATGQMGFKRHLTATEIFEQAARYATDLRRRGGRLSRIVLMGMGEPLANYDNVVEAVRRIHADLGIGWRKITISTVGLVPEIRRLANENFGVKLAVSLHAATNKERSALLPMNKRYPIEEVLAAARDYGMANGRRVTFEYALIAGKNDGADEANRLGVLLGKTLPGSHVNLIPVNPTAGYNGKPTRPHVVERFVDVLADYGITATVRMRRGIDIDAGCGQLAERALESPDVPIEFEEAVPF